MTRWRKHIRFVIMAVAGFVLLVTVLPQVASGIGLGGLANRLDSTTCSSSGSSGTVGNSGTSGSSSSCCSGSSGSSGSSTCPTGPGTVSGSVTVTGAPAGFYPAFVGAGACPYIAATQPICANPQYSLSPYYSLTLTPGMWWVDGFYENGAFGGANIGTPQMVTVAPGAVITLNLTVPYAKPATLHVTVNVKNLPAGTVVTNETVVLCPLGVPYDGVTTPLTCVSGGNYSYPPTSGPFTITGLPPGKWTAYPGYCSQFGCAENPNAGKAVTTRAGKTSKVTLSTGYLAPPEGQLVTTESVTGAPAGFNDPVGMMACQIGGYGYCEGTGSFGGGTQTLLLNDGPWEVVGYYTVSPFGNAISGAPQYVDIQGGQTTTLSLLVPYQLLGTAAGSIKITGLPGGVHATGFSVQACPVGPAPGSFSFLSCVYEVSGTGAYSFGAADPKRLGRSATRGTLPKAAGTAIDTYDLPTLTPGLWDIQVTYSTPFGSFYPPNGTIVDVTAGQTITTKVKVPYVAPRTGVVKGNLTVVHLPGYSQSLVRACNSEPVGGVCTGEVDAYVPNLGFGPYVLNLTSGTWWVQGVAYIYSGLTTETLTSPVQQVTVAVGRQYKANFTVTGP